MWTYSQIYLLKTLWGLFNIEWFCSILKKNKKDILSKVSELQIIPNTRIKLRNKKPKENIKNKKSIEELYIKRCVYDPMVRRCYKDSDINYKYYGERGIDICNEWLNNPDIFIKWCLDNKYIRHKTQVDRIDNNKGYSPDNCRVVSPEINANNRRNSIKIKIGDNTYTIKELSQKYNISIYRLYSIFKFNSHEFDSDLEFHAILSKR